jgi:hypothetical protein
LFSSSSFLGGNLPDNTGVLIPAPGVWLISYVVKLSTTNATGQISHFFTRIDSPSAGYTSTALGISEVSAPSLTTNTTSSITANGSGVLTVTNSTTYIYINSTIGIIAGPMTISNNSYLQFTRIA